MGEERWWLEVDEVADSPLVADVDEQTLGRLVNEGIARMGAALVVEATQAATRAIARLRGRID